MRIEDSLHNALMSHDPEVINQVFEDIYVDYSNLLFFVSKEYVLPCDAEDIVQETFIDFFNHLDSINEIKSIKSYLVSSVRNRCLNFIKAKEALIEREDEVCSVDNDNFIATDKWQKGLNQLEVYVIVEHVLVGKKLVEIAKEKNVSSNTLKSTYRRALKKAKKNLEGNASDE